MISFVKGILEEKRTESIVVENQGIGFEILVPATVLDELPQTGNQVKIFTYMHVKEDDMKLFGFLSGEDLEMFKLLIKVNGIGPKGALAILSVMDVDQLRFAILADDAKAISKAPGIGAKTASKLILELKDKVDLEDMLRGPQKEGKAESRPTVSSAGKEAIEALVALGYSSTEATQAVRQVDIEDHMTVEDVLKLSLKNM
ncbi:MAG: Holliday junction branch migration protein RuvA [Eubacterium sp.]|nr:Holliday junction branch migration protein RuvA [Eubacterium sp.]